MRTRARRDGDDWILNGTKMWITNGSVADVAVVWARHRRAAIRGFVVPTDTPGFAAREIHKKLSLRASVTAELVLDDVRLPGSAPCCPRSTRAAGPALVPERGPLRHRVRRAGRGPRLPRDGARYARTREQFDRPIAGVPAHPAKLADMALELNKGTLLALHLGRLKDAGTLRPEQVSVGKLNNVREAIAIAREAAPILGANGITLEYPVMRHMNNLESCSPTRAPRRSTRWWSARR